jgi:hypothetical protein
MELRFIGNRIPLTEISVVKFLDFFKLKIMIAESIQLYKSFKHMTSRIRSPINFNSQKNAENNF